MGRSRPRAVRKISFQIPGQRRNICTTRATRRNFAMQPTSAKTNCLTTTAMSPSALHFRSSIQVHGETNLKASQLRVDTTQIHAYMDIIAPLAWTAIASVEPDKAGKISLEQLGFKTPQATQGTSKILLTQGTGKMAVNVSRAPGTSIFVKALNVIIAGAKIAAPLVTLPAISVPALNAFTEVMSYWEDRTRFVMAGNLTTAVATQQAHGDPDREDHYIGLLSGDYLMVPQKHTDELAKALPNLDLVQGYLVRKDADPNLPLQRARRMPCRELRMLQCASV